MGKRYRYDYRSHWRKDRHIALVFLGLALTASIASLIIYKSINTNKTQVVNGPSKVVGQVLGTSSGATMPINEPYFTFDLPNGWHQTATVSTSQQYSFSWEADVVGTRYLTIYIDHYPPNIAINRLLPIQAVGQSINYGILSDNCANFTPGTPGDSNEAPVQAKWQGVSFWCDLPDWIDNKVGTGSTTGINTTTIAGPKDGAHNYFFLYTDRSTDPDYSIFYSILTSFKAK